MALALRAVRNGAASVKVVNGDIEVSEDATYAIAAIWMSNLGYILPQSKEWLAFAQKYRDVVVS